MIRILITTFLIFFGGQAMANEFTLEKVDLFVANAPAMVRFYEAVFEMKMQETDAGPYKFYIGKIPGFTTLQFVPEELSGIKFQQNRHQFNFRVKDLNQVIRTTLANGGTQQGEIIRNGKDRIFSVTDPEHNFIVFAGE